MKKVVLVLLVVALAYLAVDAVAFTEKEPFFVENTVMNAGCLYLVRAEIVGEPAWIPVSVHLISNGNEYQYIKEYECPQKIVLQEGQFVILSDTEPDLNMFAFESAPNVPEGWEAIIFFGDLEIGGSSLHATIFLPSHYFIEYLPKEYLEYSENGVGIKILQESNALTTILGKDLFTTKKPLEMQYVGYLPAENGWVQPGIAPEVGKEK